MNPIKKKLKLEGKLQGGSGLKTNIFDVKDENGNVTPVPQEEASPKVNVEFEDSHSQIAGQENSEKLEFDQSYLQEEHYQAEESNSGKSKSDGSYSPAKPKVLSNEEELAKEKEIQIKKTQAEFQKNYR